MSARSVSRPGDDLTGVAQPASVASLAGLAVVSLSTVLMLQSMRVFVSYLVFVIDQSNRTTLAGIATGVFLASGLGWFLVKAAGIRSTVLVSAGALAASRFILQLWQAPDARLWLGAAAIISWGWMTYALLVSRREVVALGLGLGLAIDLGVSVAFQTVDLPWMPAISSDALTAAIIAAFLGTLARFELPSHPRGSTARASVALLAIGPALAFYLLVFGNLGLAQSHLGLDFPGASVVLTFGMAIGVLTASLRCSGEMAVLAIPRWRRFWRVGLAVLVAEGFWWFWLHRPLSAVGLVLCSAASIILLTELLLDDRSAEGKPGLVMAAFFFTLGLLAEVGLLFGYYTRSGSPAVLVVLILFFLAGALTGAMKPVARSRDRGLPVVVISGVVGGLLLLLSGWQVWSWNDASASDAIGPDITVMTYNIHDGFSSGQRFDLEQIARVIEEQHPDIVVLQEVSRGWLVTSGADEVLWLSQRLNMNYAFGPNSDDGMWGNVVLSQAPIESVRKVQYDVTENLKRSALEVDVTTQTGDLWVLATHLDDPRDAGTVRLEQARELIAAWNHQSPTLLMGDMNSDPTDPVIATFRSAGFVDLGGKLDPPQTTSTDGRRIDYIFGTPDVGLSDLRVLNVWTSDHRPVVARISLPPHQANGQPPTIGISVKPAADSTSTTPVAPRSSQGMTSGRRGF